MNISKMLIISTVLFCNIFPVAEAQVKGIEKGDKIRVTAPGEFTSKRTGIVTDVTGDSLQFMHRDSSINVSLASISRLELSTGKKRSAGRGALIGAGSLGLTLGLIMMSTDESCSSDEGWCIDLFSRSDSFKLGLVSGALLGGVSGAIIVHFIIRDRWEKIELEPVALLSQTNGRISAIGIRLRFR